MRVKDGTKVHTEEVVGFGSKAEIEKLMLDLEGRQDDDEEEAATEGEQGTCTFNMIVEHATSISFTSYVTCTCFRMFSSTFALFSHLILQHTVV